MKNLFVLFLLLSIGHIPLQICAQLSLHPLTPSSSFANASARISPPTSNTDSLKLKLPYIEDFSGPMVPIQQIDTVSIDSINYQGYKITHLKMHGLYNGEKINIYNIKPSIKNCALAGYKYVKIPYTYIYGDTTFSAIVLDSVKIIDTTVSVLRNIIQTQIDTVLLSGNYTIRQPFLHLVSVNTNTNKDSSTQSILSHGTPQTSTPVSYTTANGTFSVYTITTIDTLFQSNYIDTLIYHYIDTIAYSDKNGSHIGKRDTYKTRLLYTGPKIIYDSTSYYTIDTSITSSGFFPDRYSFLVYDDSALTQPTQIFPTDSIPNYVNWARFLYNGYSTTPDTLGFESNNGGCTITDGIELNPISVGVVSFDGINYLGQPYSTTNVNGYADVLLSLPFDLSRNKPKDSIYMSFFWQPGGLGEYPDINDYLLLEFKDSSDTWQQVWQQYGGDTTSVTDTFFVQMIPIAQTGFLHNDFQYRFRSHGNLSGHFDVWNVDYIYIDTSRTVLQPYTQDITMLSAPDNLLKNYRSVPYKHFVSLSPSQQTAQLNLQPYLKIRNMDVIHHIADTFSNGAVTPEMNLLTFDNLGHTVFDTSSQRLTGTYIDSFQLKTAVNPAYMTAPYVLKQTFSFDNFDAGSTPGKTEYTYDFSFNNYKTIETYFYNFYAYDDWTPEYTLKSNLSGLNVANKYTILANDTLTHMDFCFLKNNGPDLTGFALYMNVWDSQVDTIASQPISIVYSSVVNGFTRYEFFPHVPLKAGTYYFGYQQFFNLNLFIGYDRDNNFLSNIYYNNYSNQWDSFDTLTTMSGAMMIRPVFNQDNEILTSTVKKVPGEGKQFVIFPNPNKGEIHFLGDPEYISVYDLGGREILSQNITTSSVSLPQSLSNGLYIISLTKGNYSEVHKLILIHE